MLWNWSELGILLATAVGLGAGTIGGVIRGWSLLSRLYSLEDRLTVVEGTLLREVKTRAANSRFQRPDKEVMAVDEKVLALQAPKPAAPFWTNPMGLPRSYDGK